ncbi:MAG: DNA-3-methyladenine glycosylase 2 family protein [Halioglobus sp.]|nr:DNA-3-methyladenine glycosylase 2 family protein [Halioglobus sp.]
MLSLRLPYRVPYRWADVLRFYGLRAIPGVEEIEGSVYRRVLRFGEVQSTVQLCPHEDEGHLLLSLQNVPAKHVAEAEQKAREVFDLDAPVSDIHAGLSRDTRLRCLLGRQTGVRVPGAWNGFELAVRAILGQQISVKAATTLSGRIAARYGTALVARCGTLTHLFPEPGQLVRARFSNIGIVRSRAETLRRLAQAVEAGEIGFDPQQDMGLFRERLTSIRGIGDWTAEYVMMRALKNPDAFPSSDLGLVKALIPGERVSPAALKQRAESWRPWRAYAAMLLWGSATSGGG